MPRIKPENILYLINLNNLKFYNSIFIDDKGWLGKSHLNVNGAEKHNNYTYENILYTEE